MKETITNNHKASGGSTVVRVTRRLEKIAQIFELEAETTVPNPKGQIIYIKAKNIDIIPPSKLLKYLQQTTFPPKKLPGPSKSSPI